MRHGFTLIELLVVLSIFAVVIALTAPKGSKLLESFVRFNESIETKHARKMQQAYAFIEANSSEAQEGNVSYFFTRKGLVIEKIDAHH